MCHKNYFILCNSLWQYITNSKLKNIGGIVTGIDTIFITPKDFEKLDELIEDIRGMVR